MRPVALVALLATLALAAAKKGERGEPLDPKSEHPRPMDSPMSSGLGGTSFRIPARQRWSEAHPGLYFPRVCMFHGES